jgi:hypothetical protein
MLNALLEKAIRVSKNDIVCLVRDVSLAYFNALEQSYWYSKAAPIQALASFTLPRGKASSVDLVMRYCELVNASTQFFAAVVRLIFPVDESRIDLTIDWAVLRFVLETEIADWMI